MRVKDRPFAEDDDGCISVDLAPGGRAVAVALIAAVFVGSMLAAATADMYSAYG